MTRDVSEPEMKFGWPTKTSNSDSIVVVNWHKRAKTSISKIRGTDDENLLSRALML